MSVNLFFQTKIIRRIIVLFFIVLALFFLVGVFLIDYTAGLALSLGLSLPLLINFALKFLLLHIKASNSITKTIFIQWLFLLLLSTVFFVWFVTGTVRTTLGSDSIEKYNVDIELINGSYKRFEVEETAYLYEDYIDAIYNSANISESDSDESELARLLSKQELSREISSNDKSIIIKELYFVPLNMDTDGYVDLKLTNGKSRKVEFCINECPPSIVKIFDLPAGSFYQAEGADNLQIDSYLNKETVSWNPAHVERGIRFAYIKPPYHHLRRIIKPFLSFANLNQNLIVIIGFTTTTLLAFMLKPVINVKAIAKAESQSMSEGSKYDMRGANFPGGFAERNYGKMVENQHNYAPEEKQNLAEAAGEIQQLLDQLSTTYPTTTSAEKMAVVAEAADQIEKNPPLKARVINALKSGGTEAFKEAIDHPLVNVLVATIEGWQETE